MQPQYVALSGTTAKKYSLNTNCAVFNVAIRLAAGVTLTLSLEDDGNDTTAPNSYTPPVTGFTPVYGAAPAAVNGVITLTSPVATLLFTPTSGGTCTVLQQGI
jgi:hypothetical protein